MDVGRRDVRGGRRATTRYTTASIERDRGGDRRADVQRVRCVRAGERAVQAGEQERGVARQVDRAPRRSGQMPHRERGALDRDESPEREHADRHLPRLPVAGERHEHVDEVEVDVVVRDEGPDVHDDERDREARERPVQVEQPGRPAMPGEQTAREEDTPHDRRREEQPRRHPGCPRQEPPELRIHPPTPARTAPRAGVVVVTPSSVVAIPFTPTERM